MCLNYVVRDARIYAVARERKNRERQRDVGEGPARLRSRVSTAILDDPSLNWPAGKQPGYFDVHRPTVHIFLFLPFWIWCSRVGFDIFWIFFSAPIKWHWISVTSISRSMSSTWLRLINDWRPFWRSVKRKKGRDKVNIKVDGNYLSECITLNVESSCI